MANKKKSDPRDRPKSQQTLDLKSLAIMFLSIAALAIAVLVLSVDAMQLITASFSAIFAMLMVFLFNAHANINELIDASKKTETQGREFYNQHTASHNDGNKASEAPRKAKTSTLKKSSKAATPAALPGTMAADKIAKFSKKRDFHKGRKYQTIDEVDSAPLEFLYEICDQMIKILPEEVAQCYDTIERVVRYEPGVLFCTLLKVGSIYHIGTYLDIQTCRYLYRLGNLYNKLVDGLIRYTQRATYADLVTSVI